MSHVHPLYHKILEDLINQDNRDFLPEHANRLDVAQRYLNEDTEEITETKTQNPAPPV